MGSVTATLTAVFPPELEWQLVLAENMVTIGRDGDAKVPAIANRTVSRRHLSIHWDGTAHVVSDLGAHNGSRLSGESLDDRGHSLVDGMVLQLGDVFLVYERGAAASDGDRVSKQAVPGRSAAVRRLRAAIERAAGDPSPALLLGETGTGKEWIAGELHRLGGRTGPLVALNCAALGAQIVESQLFGHVRGAFTGATTDHQGLFRAADKGTLFLDEIGEMALELQPKLLRTLQDGQVMSVGATRAQPVDVRVVAATNRDLDTAVEQRTFRLDLHSRLSLWKIEVPPLRERRVDILAWLELLYRRWLVARRADAAPLALLPDAVEAILLHEWPDNLRGLDRLVHALQGLPGPIARVDLPAWLSTAASPLAPAAAQPRVAVRQAPTREEFERAYEQLAGNVRALSRHFGRDRRQVYRWLAAYGLKRNGDSGDDACPD
jgi:transcriptional regulator with GAF, ATPase, and Fis domain